MTPVRDRSVLRARRHRQKWRADRDRRTQIRHGSPSEQSRFDGEKFKNQGKKKKAPRPHAELFLAGRQSGLKELLCLGYRARATSLTGIAALSSAVSQSFSVRFTCFWAFGLFDFRPMR
jgi:hypothetical protein